MTTTDGGSLSDGEEMIARNRALPQEHACPTCGGPVISRAQAEAEWADYCAWVDSGRPAEVLEVSE